MFYYTIPRKIRELQLGRFNWERKWNYTIPRKIRELQSKRPRHLYGVIIPYQEKLGNYNSLSIICCEVVIIPYQEKLGNYNFNR